MLFILNSFLQSIVNSLQDFSLYFISFFFLLLFCWYTFIIFGGFCGVFCVSKERILLLGIKAKNYLNISKSSSKSRHFFQRELFFLYIWSKFIYLFKYSLWWILIFKESNIKWIHILTKLGEIEKYWFFVFIFFLGKNSLVPIYNLLNTWMVWKLKNVSKPECNFVTEDT